MYFECNLPRYAQHAEAELQKKYAATIDTLYDRTKLLNCAMNLSTLNEADFARSAKAIFDTFPNFDKMTGNEIANLVERCYDGKKTPARIEWPNTIVLVDTAFVTVDEWEVIRHCGIGGSDAAVILGCSPYRTEQELYYDKCGCPRMVENKSNAAIFQRGHVLEENVIDTFCRVKGFTRIPETRMFASKKNPCCTANIDAICISPRGDIIIFEAKTTIEENRNAWLDGKIPEQYIPQMRQYAAVLNDDRIGGVYIGCLFTSDTVIDNSYFGSSYNVTKFLCRFLERDIAKETSQLQEEAAWWQKHITNGALPEVSSDAERNNSVLEMYVVGTANTDLPPVCLDYIDFQTPIKKYLELQKEEKKVKGQLAEISSKMSAVKAPLLVAIGRAPEAEVDIGNGSFYAVSYKGRNQTRVDTDKLKAFFPEAYDACVSQETTARTFSISKKDITKSKRCLI